jgi:hypothetical protein
MPFHAKERSPFAMKILLTGLFVVSSPCALLVAQPPAQQASGPQVTITLKDRHGQATPLRQGFTHTGGGNIDVAQPAPDTVVVTMTAVAVAGAHPCQNSTASMTFALDQGLEIAFDNPKIKRGKLTMEGRVIGLLRSHTGGGSANQGPAHAVVTSGPTAILSLALPTHCVTGGENLSVNDRLGPLSLPVVAGEYHLHQAFAVSASHPWSLKPCKAASSEFAPDPALDPLWISYWEPFHGANKKDFGFQVILKVAPE